ncbi:MAG: hypothetical protein SH856_02235 [Flavobacteriales bacterium]|nr:hypothetical protein [Flavobacteriales bacterium]
MRKKDTQQTRDRIRARMMRNASELWGQPNASLESFDPLVGMLIGACAAEVEKVYNDLQTSQSRVLERLAHLLTPQVLKGARAAHGILYSRGVEPVAPIKREFQYFIQKKSPSRESSSREDFTQVFFSPVQQIKVWDAGIKMMVSGRIIQSVANVFDREVVSEARGQKKFQPNILYIGVEMNRRIENISGLSFYFDWINDADRNHYYRLLPLTQWFVGNSPLQITQGLPQLDQQHNAIGDFEIELENDLSKVAEKSVSQLYDQRFITISQNMKMDTDADTKKYPSEFENVFSTQELAPLKDSLLWLRVEFPPAMNPDALADVICSLNCYPVINRRLHEFSYRLQSGSNIIPLKSEGELFFSLKAVRSSSGNQFIPAAAKDIMKSQADTYLLRQGGVERFDARTASELLTYLLDLLRDESASFAIYGNDLISTNLRELQQLMNSLSQKVDATNLSEEQVSYLIINSTADTENIFTEFWGTHGEFANNIRSSAKLMPFSGYEVRSESVMMLTNTQGGRDNLTNNETLDAFRKALMTRGRVVTPNDIRLLVQHEMGSRVAGVEVKRGMRISADAKHGYERSVDVIITPSDEISNHGQWEGMCASLENTITMQTSGYYPVRVLMSNQKERA